MLSCRSNCITMFGRKTPTGSMRKAIVRCVTGRSTPCEADLDRSSNPRMIKPRVQCVDSPQRPLLKRTHDQSLPRRRTNERWATTSLTRGTVVAGARLIVRNGHPVENARLVIQASFSASANFRMGHAGLAAKLLGRNRIASSQLTYDQFE